MNDTMRLMGLDEGSVNATMPSDELRKAGYRLLLPSRRNPYYIVAPEYTRHSAGIKVLHMLCNALNRAGERAYLITYPYSAPGRST